MTVRFSNLTAQYLSVKDEFDHSLVEILLSGEFIGGRHVREFEVSFAEFVGVESCIGVANGTDALEIILEGALPKGSRVGVPANSFIATAEAVSRTGNTPVLLDVDETFNLSLASVSQAIEHKFVDAIIIVHLFGRPVSEDVISFLERSNLPFFEDCAQAHGAQVGGRNIGGIGVASSFSFFPGKNLGAFGDAGAICTSNAELAETFRRIRNHGRLGKFDHELIGRNSRLDAIQAAILRAKLSRLDEWTEARRANASLYRELLKENREVSVPLADELKMRSVYHHFVIRSQNRSGLINHLNGLGIETGIHYPETISNSQAYQNLPRPLTTKNADAFSKEILSLPIGEHLTPAEIRLVANEINEFTANSVGGRD
jgi:dTDP-4-amino-4,6-dideoxygalactose transaminase